MDSEADHPRVNRLYLFFIWLALFYTAWLVIVTVGNHWQLLLSHWPIALTMALGSYVAGSTPMGGGTVAFPILVLLFEFPGSLGRNFALAIQSIGMVSASVYILTSGKPVHWRLLTAAVIGAAIGMPFGAAYVAPVVPDLWVKLTFGVIWASFGVLHLLKLQALVELTGHGTSCREGNLPFGLFLGISGGIGAAITGVGIDMLIYAALVLLYRSDLKIAIATSVVLMAFTSVVGIASNLVLAYTSSAFAISPEVFANWLAAAPVVALGAPIGALVVSLMPRAATLVIVSLLCVGQFVWMIVDQGVTGAPLVVALMSVLGCNLLFHGLDQLGQRAARRTIDNRNNLSECQPDELA